MTMLEKAARALSDHFKCEWETMRGEDREMIRGYARAVLMAVREPNADMSRAGGKVFNQTPAPNPVFTAMIDAILNEGAKTSG